jgi:hypothetical protein
MSARENQSSRRPDMFPEQALSNLDSIISFKTAFYTLMNKYSIRYYWSHHTLANYPIVVFVFNQTFDVPRP